MRLSLGKKCVDTIAHDWFRILKNPKVRGHENTAEIHPMLCTLLSRCFGHVVPGLLLKNIDRIGMWLATNLAVVRTFVR